jgi:hypothetical protein
VPRLDEVRELVEQHIVEHPAGHTADLVGDPDRALSRRAGAPAGLLVRHPPDARGLGSAAEVGGREVRCARPEVAVRAASTLLGSGHAGQHRADPLALLGAGEPSRDQHDEATLLTICGHRAAPPGAAAHLDRHPVDDRLHDLPARPLPRRARDRVRQLWSGPRHEGRVGRTGDDAMDDDRNARSQARRRRPVPRGPYGAPCGDERDLMLSVL